MGRESGMRERERCWEQVVQRDSESRGVIQILSSRRVDSGGRGKKERKKMAAERKRWLMN